MIKINAPICRAYALIVVSLIEVAEDEANRLDNV